jgi:DNA-binding NtrC family response regulator
MSGFASNYSIRQPEELTQNGNGQSSKFASGNGSSANRSEFLESRINCLKILALSLLREIASVEKVGENLGKDTIDLQGEVRRFEAELIRSALIQTGGRQRPAARLLGTKITTLNTKIKRYKIDLTQTDSPHLD